MSTQSRRTILATAAAGAAVLSLTVDGHGAERAVRAPTRTG